MHLFDRDIACKSTASLSVECEISDNWSINGVPNGGFVLALIARAMMLTSDKSSTPILTASYLARCTPGPATIVVEPVARSKQFSRYQARLLQDGEEKVRAMGTFALAKDECFVERTETPVPAFPPLAECFFVPEFPKYTLYSQMDVMLDPGYAGWIMGTGLSEESMQRGWIRFKDERAFDIYAITLATDAFPPAVLASQGIIAWVPTLELSVNIRRVPETKWLKCQYRTRFITCGLVEEDGELWDEDGNLVAISRQIAQFRKAEI